MIKTLLSLVISVFVLSSTAQALELFGYTEEEIQESTRIYDRVAIMSIEKALKDKFVGNQVFPNSSNQATSDYIDYLLKPYFEFYVHGELPETMRLLPVAGPTGVAKTLIERETLALLIEHKLQDPDKHFFRQGDNNAEIDLSLLDRYKVKESTYNAFKSTDSYEKKKEIFWKVAAVVVFDEASHNPTLDSEDVFEAVKKEIEKFLAENPPVVVEEEGTVEKP
ncbi:MAG: hypothetical protein AAF202_12870, partial [Pseudomonadota bacterium]